MVVGVSVSLEIYEQEVDLVAAIQESTDSRSRRVRARAILYPTDVAQAVLHLGNIRFQTVVKRLNAA
jgi:hypothetical protein